MEMQKAWFYNEYGPAEVLQCGEYPVPELGANQVLVRVRAAALNPLDFIRRNGLLKDFDSKFPAVPGCDMVGVIVDQGDDVTKFSKGDEVYGSIHNYTCGRPKQCGTLAQYTAGRDAITTNKNPPHQTKNSTQQIGGTREHEKTAPHTSKQRKMSSKHEKGSTSQSKRLTQPPTPRKEPMLNNEGSRRQWKGSYIFKKRGKPINQALQCQNDRMRRLWDSQIL